MCEYDCMVWFFELDAFAAHCHHVCVCVKVPLNHSQPMIANAIGKFSQWKIVV